ncbi:MAG: 50S ribosomal protein L5 [Candidatus Woesearchaeota archaeon]|nr:50S ribosomal protein L5 [Candidatus Woesearchaeota archaeon]
MEHNKDRQREKKENPMTKIRVEKLTLNIGAGKDQVVLNKGVKLIKSITGIDPVKTVTQKRIPSWGLRPGLPIGCKITIRGQKAVELIKRLIDAKSYELSERCFDENGSVSFGILEYIDIKGVKYDPEIGIMGLQVCITLEKPGYRVKRRRIMRTAVSKSHRIIKKEAVDFMISEFNVKIGEEE